MKNFTEKDLAQGLTLPTIYASQTDLVLSLLPWQKRGLQQTASGYGRKLTSSWKINFCGKLYRVYFTVISNSGSTWFISKGKKIFIN